VISFIQRNNEM